MGVGLGFPFALEREGVLAPFPIAPRIEEGMRESALDHLWPNFRQSNKYSCLGNLISLNTIALVTGSYAHLCPTLSTGDAPFLSPLR